MNKIHRTEEGRRIYISQMENSNLKNTIIYILRKIENNKRILNSSGDMTQLKMVLYNIVKDNLIKEAGTEIKISVEKLYPYLAEAMLRGFNFSAELQTTFDRKGKEELFITDINDF